MNSKQKQYIYNTISSKIIFDEPLKNHTSFGIGGPASCFIYPKNRQELSKLLQYTKKENMDT